MKKLISDIMNHSVGRYFLSILVISFIIWASIHGVMLLGFFIGFIGNCVGVVGIVSNYGVAWAVGFLTICGGLLILWPLSMIFEIFTDYFEKKGKSLKKDVEYELKQKKKSGKTTGMLSKL